MVSQKDNIANFKTVDGLVVGSQICREISNSIKNKQKITKNVDKLAKILKRRIYMNWILKLKRFGESIKKCSQNFLKG